MRRHNVSQVITVSKAQEQGQTNKPEKKKNRKRRKGGGTIKNKKNLEERVQEKAKSRTKRTEEAVRRKRER